MASCAIAVDRASKSNGYLQVTKGSRKCGRIELGRRGDQAGADLKRVNALLERLALVYAELNSGDKIFSIVIYCIVLIRIVRTTHGGRSSAATTGGAIILTRTSKAAPLLLPIGHHR